MAYRVADDSSIQRVGGMVMQPGMPMLMPPAFPGGMMNPAAAPLSRPLFYTTDPRAFHGYPYLPPAGQAAMMHAALMYTSMPPFSPGQHAMWGDPFAGVPMSATPPASGSTGMGTGVTAGLPLLAHTFVSQGQDVRLAMMAPSAFHAGRAALIPHPMTYASPALIPSLATAMPPAPPATAEEDVSFHEAVPRVQEPQGVAAHTAWAWVTNWPAQGNITRVKIRLGNKVMALADLAQMRDVTPDVPYLESLNSGASVSKSAGSETIHGNAPVLLSDDVDDEAHDASGAVNEATVTAPAATAAGSGDTEWDDSDTEYEPDSSLAASDTRHQSSHQLRLSDAETATLMNLSNRHVRLVASSIIYREWSAIRQDLLALHGVLPSTKQLCNKHYLESQKLKSWETAIARHGTAAERKRRRRVSPDHWHRFTDEQIAVLERLAQEHVHTNPSQAGKRDWPTITALFNELCHTHVSSQCLQNKLWAKSQQVASQAVH